MQPLLTPQQCRRLDHIAIEERGVPSLDLMERAARAVAEAAEDLLSDRRRENEFAPAAFCSGGSDKLPEPVRALLDRRRQDSAPWAAVFCGPGNNGGDGLAAARLLLQRGVSVRTILVGDWAKMTADAREMARRLQAVGGEIEAFDPDDLEQSAWLGLCDCAIDALLGVGLKRPVQRAFLAAVRRLNSLSCPVVACDLPTGLDGDTGRVLGEAVRADMTVTFTAAKPGLYLDQGRVYSGQVRVIDIGLPNDLTAPLLTGGNLWAVKGPDTLPRRPRTAHRGTSASCFFRAAAWASPVPRCLPPDLPSAPARDWCFWPCQKTFIPSWPSSATRPCPSPSPTTMTPCSPVPRAATRPSSAPAWGPTPLPGNWPESCFRTSPAPWCWTPTA